MKNYALKVKANSTCPAKANVMSLLDKGAASFKTIIGETPLRGFYPVYVETETRENLYGFINEVTDNGSVLTAEQIGELIKTKPEVKLESYSGNIMSGAIIVNDVQQTAVEDTFVSERIQKVIDQKVADGIVSQEDVNERLAFMQANKVAEPIMFRVFKGYRKYNKPAHRPRTLYVDPFLKESLSSKREGVVAEGLRCAVLRMPTICEGEKSVGKNVYMETLAWLLGMPLYMIGFSRNMNPNSIYGEKSTDNSASDELRQLDDGAIAKIMLSTNQEFRSAESRANAIKKAAAFEMAKARAASVSIITDASELYDWMTDGGLMVWNGATCSATSLKR